MKQYNLYGMYIESDFDFVQLEPIEEIQKEKADVTICEGVIADEYKKDRECYSKIRKDISYLSNHTCYLLIENGNKITYEKKENAKINNLNAFLLGWGIAIICYQKDKLAIHCSCIADAEGAILISGTSGSGKSSITSYLLNKGYKFIADDMAVVSIDENGTAYAFPAFPYQKLCRDIATKSGLKEEEMIYIDENKDKFLVPYKGDFVKESVPVKAMIILGFSEGNEVLSGEIEGVDKIYACVNSLFLKGLLKKKAYYPENINNCLKLASAIPIYYVSRPFDMDTKEEVMKVIRKMI